jgi:cytoskeleton protein RodZ
MDNEIAAIREISKMTNQSENSKLSGLGFRLQKSRESMHLTQKEAAARLYLNPKIVEIIENEAFHEGPPLTFMRGYLRSYARLLNLPEGEIKAAIEELELNAIPVVSTMPALQKSPIYRGDRYIRWISYLIILILVSLVVVWWSSHSKYVIADVPPAIATNTDTKNIENTPAATTELDAETAKATPSEVVADVSTGSQATISEPAYVAPQAVQPPPVGTINTPITTSIAPSLSIIPPVNTEFFSPTTQPGVDNTATSAVAETTAPKEKPSTPKKKHKRHQYRPIENMDIPEPD